MRNSPPETQTAIVNPYAYPLDEFCALAGRPLPLIQMIPGDQVPEPCKTLLVHTNDMTPTLEQFFGELIHLEVLHREHRNGFYFREVVLLLDETGKRTEFGAIKINLSLLPPPARKLILEERLPLGAILHQQGIQHFSRPKAYLRIQSDDYINKVLGLSGRHTLYGRRNNLIDPSGMALAEIVEILPPTKLPARP
jgi:chorismate-pyruvate lyase